VISGAVANENFVSIVCEHRASIVSIAVSIAVRMNFGAVVGVIDRLALLEWGQGNRFSCRSSLRSPTGFGGPHVPPQG
jgi:hypothetical protein